jgi:hypothetical protein
MQRLHDIKRGGIIPSLAEPLVGYDGLFEGATNIISVYA